MRKALLVIRDYETHQPFDYVVVNEEDLDKAYQIIEDYDKSREELYFQGEEWDYNHMFEVLEENGIQIELIHNYKNYDL